MDKLRSEEWKRLRIYYENAKPLCIKLLNKKLYNLRGKLSSLRSEYKDSTDEDRKKAIKLEGENTKEEIRFYESIPTGVQMVGVGSQMKI